MYPVVLNFFVILNLVAGWPAFGSLSSVETQHFPINSSYQPLGPWITQQIHRDLATQVQPSAIPARTYSNVWIRVFPQLDVPLGDPYADTQNVYRFKVSHPQGFDVYSFLTQQKLITTKTIEFDFLSLRYLPADGRWRPLEALWLIPKNKSLSLTLWDENAQTPKGESAETQVKYRGAFLLLPTSHVSRKIPPLPSRELWSIINVVSLEDYLISVVPSEVLSSWHKETLKAQAIAARTYGLYEMAASRIEGLPFDVEPSTWYQSYQGAEFRDRQSKRWRKIELASTTRAVIETRRKVIVHNQEIIKAFFSSNAGGRTCLASECLELNSNPSFIHETKDHPEVREMPGGTWGSRANITSDRIRARLKEFDVIINQPVIKLEHLEKGPSGRTWRLRLRLNDQSVFDLNRQLTRRLMNLFGPIRSFWYQLGAMGEDGKQPIVGFGYGHAVGLSQWGAQLYARRNGWTDEQILKHYYRSVVIQDFSE